MRNTICIALIAAILLQAISAEAATYYVSTSGNDANPGTSESPYRTIQRCANAVVAGDTCYVAGGTYGEPRISIARSGTPGNYINLVGADLDDKPIIKGFLISGANYVRLIGFEITHDALADGRGIIFSGNSSHVEILNNYFHHTAGHAIYSNNAVNSFIVVRGNEMYYLGCPVPGTSCPGNAAAVGTSYNGVHHWLIEYNHVERAGDFINMPGDNAIIRNNYLHDFRNSYWPVDQGGGGDNLHADMFQPVGGGNPIQNQTYESNFMGDNIEINSHILQMRANDPNAKNIVFRGNVGYNHGSGAMQSGGVDNVYYYSNTLHSVGGMWYNAEPRDTRANPSQGNYNFNNIYSAVVGNSLIIFDVADGCSLYASHNLCPDNNPSSYQLYTFASCISNSSASFANAASNDYHLTSASNAIGIGKPITAVTSTAGSGTIFIVENAGFFNAGLGMAEGDIIKVGSNLPMRITSITGNTITVDRSISWNNGDGVYWRNQDTNPDIGAYEYRVSGYGITNSLNLNNGDSVSGNVTLVATVNDPVLVRFIEFWIDGLPVGIDYDAPYQYNWDTSSLAQGSTHSIKAVARPLYAGNVLAYEDSATIIIGGNSDLPDERKIDWSSAGIPGGIPNRTTICTNVKDAPYNAYGDGVHDDTAAIQQAIEECAQDSVVYIPAGIYMLTNTLMLENKGVIIRGDGIGETVLKMYGLASPIVLRTTYPLGGWSEVNVTAGIGKGSYEIPVQNPDVFEVGGVVLIDQLNDPSFVNSSSPGYGPCTWCSRQGGNRSLGQHALVTAINGNMITINNPLYFSLNTNLAPQAVYRGQWTKNAGIEDLTVEQVNDASGACNIVINGCEHCWIRNVETINSSTCHLKITGSYGTEIRDSYFHHGHSYGSGRSYGVFVQQQSSDSLVENNIFYYLRHSMVFEMGGSGNVFAYGYSHRMFDQNYPNTDWLMSDLSTHGSHPYMNLFEGNVGQRIGVDSVWGTASHNTFLRNFITRESQGENRNITYYLIAAEVAYGNYYNSFLGNVLGKQGCIGSVWDLGRPTHNSYKDFYDDKVNQTTIRKGNWECVSNMIDETALVPPSLYLSEKPTWFGLAPWPPIGPDPNDPSVVLNSKIPAQLRFEKMQEPAIPGDVDKNGLVNLADLQIIAASFGKNTSETGYSAAADIAAPIGRVDLFDVMVVVRNWGLRG